MLTNREKEIPELLFKGLNRTEIAQKIFVRPETVKKHVSNGYKKLQVNNKINALRKIKRF